MTKMFTPEEFLRSLSQATLNESILLTGMVKKSDEPEMILFAFGTECENWISIPLKQMVEQVEWLGKMPCRDHSHDYVQLQLKMPEDPQGRVLAALLRVAAHMSHTRTLSTAPRVGFSFQPHLGPTGFTVPAPAISMPAIPTEEDPYPGLLPFPGSTFSPCTPSYGRWCGNCRTSSPDTPPVDAVDAVCKAHDLCIDSNGHLCDCDAAFLSGMTAAIAAPGVSAEGRSYGIGAIAAFQAKPCFCYKNVLGRKIKVWGLGGRCPF